MTRPTDAFSILLLPYLADIIRDHPDWTEQECANALERRAIEILEGERD